jgi:hypothetical protein
VRLIAAEVPFGRLDSTRDLADRAELPLYYRIASTLVSGGDREEEDHSIQAVREVVAALDDGMAADAAMDMLHRYEITAPIGTAGS